jgi:hypothetical protein
VRKLRSLRGLRRPGRLVFQTFVAVCLGSGVCSSVAHASSYYYRQTLSRVLQLDDVFEKYREKTGREPLLDGPRTWASHLLWDLEGDESLFDMLSGPWLYSEADPTFQSKPADVVIHDGWCNPIIAVKDGDGLLIYSRGEDEIDDRGLLDDISNRWGFRTWYYGGKHDAVLLSKIAAAALVVAAGVLVRPQATEGTEPGIETRRGACYFPPADLTRRSAFSIQGRARGPAPGRASSIAATASGHSRPISTSRM